MSVLDDLIANFKESMAKTGQFVNGNEDTDVQTANGPLPSLAKQVKIAKSRIDNLLPNLTNVLGLDNSRTYTVSQQAWGRMNLGLDRVDNTPDSEKPMSSAVQIAIQDLIVQLQGKEVASNKNAANGYAGYEGKRLVVLNGNNVAKGYLTQNTSAERTWEMPDKDGRVAVLSDITGLNTGVNTGDETAATIKTKLGITVLSGANTGDFDSVMAYANLANFPNTGVAKRIYIAQDTATIYFWNGVAYQALSTPTTITNTDGLAEGNTNKYFTQLRSIQAVLSTYVAGTAGTVDASDTVVNAISKLQAQISGAITDYTAKLALKEATANKATDFATVNHTLYPSVQAVKTYADALVSGVIKDCGNWDASTNTFPTTGGTGAAGAIKKGNLWYVSVAGTLGGVNVNVGDSFRALVDTPGQTAANWGVLESNLGYVPYNASNPAGYISGITGVMVTTALGFTPLNAATKDASGGVPGMNGYAINVKNAPGTITSKLLTDATAPRTYTLPDKDGAIALMSDVAAAAGGGGTVNLQGDVSGSGTGTVNTTIGDHVVTLAKLAQISTGSLLGRITAATGDVEVLSAAQGKTLLALDQVNNTSDANKPVSTAQQTALNAKESLTNKATNFATVNDTLYPTVQAVKAYADSLVVGLIDDRGSYNASSNTFPTTGGSGPAGAVLKGDLWYVSGAGTLGGVAVNVGDSFRALVDAPGQTAANWSVLESNLGYVPYNATNPAGYISGITSAMVTTALGFTPYSAANPAGYITGITGVMVTTALGFTPADVAAKDASNGFVGKTLHKVNLRNNAGTFTSTLENTNTAARAYTMPDKDGVVALLSDVAAAAGGGGTVTLQGDVTGSGTGTVTTAIGANAVTLGKLAQVATATFLGRTTAATGNVEALTAAQAKVLLGVDQINNTSDANKPVSTAQQTALNAKEDTANKATDFNVIDNVKFPTTLAVKNFLDVKLAAVVVDCGNWDASSGVYPSAGGTGSSGAIKKGNLFFISGAGTIGGITLGVGDSIRALVDNPGQTNTNWDTLETNIGYVPYNSTNPAGYISSITGAMVTTALGYTPANLATKDASGGFMGLSGYKANLKNNAGTVTSTLENTATAPRAYVMPDKSGTVAMTSDITGTNSGTNTGDETQGTILSKLGLSSISGTNTGDETAATIKTKLGISTLSGSNTGDETNATILTKLGYTPFNKAGDSLTGALNFNAAASIASAATLNLGGAASNVVEVTGNVAISAITLADGQMRFVRFASTPTLSNSGTLVLPTGTTIQAYAGDWAVFVGRTGGVVQCLQYMRASGTPLFGNARDKVRNITANTGTTTIDLNNGDEATVFKVTIAANTTITFTNPPPSPNGEIFNFTLITINDGTAGRAMSFGNTIQWANKALPPRTTAANAKDVWSFYIDGGVYGGALSIEDQG